MSTSMNNGSDEETTRKNEPKPESEYVNLKVNGQDGSEVYFRISKKSELSKLMYSYCKRQELEFSTIVFLVDGHPIAGTQTAEELGLEDGDEIDAMKHHYGGGGGAI
ncbi:hypothetical protein IC582_010035 [Cucumis melo]|uniref:Small ubiquitin-related modifier 1-like n=1 Tax=Cucumis melo TaxID=3656 RepID=A0ABM3KTK9_CUCME|nr:small ubiquitin-related modifier 1-like [Cucumis melo]